MEIFFNDWDEILKDEIHKPYFENLVSFLDREYQRKTIYPPKEKILNALKYGTLTVEPPDFNNNSK